MEKRREFTILSGIFLTVFLLVGQAIVAYLMAFLSGFVYRFLHPEMSEIELMNGIGSSYSILIIILVFSELVVLLTAIIIKYRYKSSLTAKIKAVGIKPFFVLLIISFSVFSLIPFSEIENLFSEVFPRNASFYKMLIDISMLPGAIGLFMSILVVAFMPAFFEEILFRGMIQKNLSLKYGDAKALLLTSVLFAVIHLNPSVIFPIFLLSLMLGYLFLKTDNLVYPMLLHFFNNLFSLLLMRYNSFELKGFNTSIETVEHIDLYLVIPLAILTLLNVYLIYRFKIEKNIESGQSETSSIVSNS